MKLKMAAAAILNLLFLSILVKWSIFGVCAKIQGGGRHYLELLFCNAGPPTKSTYAPEIPLQILC